MTLAVVLTSRRSTWARADRALAVGRRRDPKPGTKIAAIIVTRDGEALVTYAGVGRVSDTQVSHWIVRTLLQRARSIESSLQHVSAAAHRRLLPWVHQAATPHVFIAAAISNRKHAAYWFDPRGTPGAVNKILPHGLESHFLFSGSGMFAAQRYEAPRMLRIKRLVHRYERGKLSPQYIASELAALNRAVSARLQAAGDNSVSSECVVALRHRGFRGGAGQWFFDATGNVQQGQGQIPTVSNGMPISDITEALWQDMIERMKRAASPEEVARAFFTPGRAQEIVSGIRDDPDEEFH
jgi:hypothetical protein